MKFPVKPNPDAVNFLSEAAELGKPWDGPMVPEVRPVIIPGGYSVDPKMLREADRLARMCQSKKRYACKKDAITAAAGAMGRRHNRPRMLRPYPCPVCRGWHLTKKERR